MLSKALLSAVLLVGVSNLAAAQAPPAQEPAEIIKPADSATDMKPADPSMGSAIIQGSGMSRDGADPKGATPPSPATGAGTEMSPSTRVPAPPSPSGPPASKTP